MNRDDLELRIQALLNSTGHPFQLYVERETQSKIERSSHDQVVGRHYDFHPIASEYGWQDETGASGFIDIILGARAAADQGTELRVVIETKRYEEGVGWVFLVPEHQPEDSEEVSLLRAWWSPKGAVIRWSTHSFAPSSCAAAFCVVGALTNGKGTKTKRHGERPEAVVGQLLRACEALARQDPRKAPTIEGPRFEHVYIPLLVTNCPLYVARFDPADVNPQVGVLPQRYDVRDAAFVRFQKSFPTGVQPQGDHLGAVARSLMRTAVVVSAVHLKSFLSQLYGVVKR